MIAFITPRGAGDLASLRIENTPLAPFDPRSCDFIVALSKTLREEARFRPFAEFAALAFWMREAHIKQLRQRFEAQMGERVWIGRGVAFHIAPTNVDTIFIYSWFLSMLCGNSNIIRISPNSGAQTTMLLEAVSSLLDEPRFEPLRERIAIIRYGHDDAVTHTLSQRCDVRVIWGGDATIAAIRAIALKPTAVELAFADKFSFAAINADALLEADEAALASLIERFYNDAYGFAQMACSSIRMIVWIGKSAQNAKAQARFWELLSAHVAHKTPPMAPADVMNKFVAACAMAIDAEAPSERPNPYVSRTALKRLSTFDATHHCGNGLFYEYHCDTLETLMPQIGKKYQTMAYFGLTPEYLRTLIRSHRPLGIDRIVPIGQSLDFSDVWDGFDLLRSFCREVEVR
ncbi:MAG: hypothetical protein JXK05_05210 [Campylobacterales bacterium]|nr:hypothetical protein [Campylobacterales bacterium]